MSLGSGFGFGLPDILLKKLIIIFFNSGNRYFERDSTALMAVPKLYQRAVEPIYCVTQIHRLIAKQAEWITPEFPIFLLVLNETLG
jgi:hypothetical protein